MGMLIIQQRLLSYQCQTVLEQEHALKEIAQDIALMALSRSGFFKIAAFQGGTCLRILYGLDRFSEDLDFVLEQTDTLFNWEPYVQSLKEEFNAYGYSLDVTNKTKIEKNIKVAFLKADSKGGLLILKDSRTNRPLLHIKLEIDASPPDGSLYELKYLDFPVPYGIKVQSLDSLFASKIHALLCRSYTKGRDWYDFSWYVSKQASVNFLLLDNALNQAGPWEGQNIKTSAEFLTQVLPEKVNQIDWLEARKDVARFLKQQDQSTLDLWSKDFFQSRIEKLIYYL